MSTAALLERSNDHNHASPRGERDEVIARALDRLAGLTRRMLRGYPRLRRWEETDDVLQEAAMRLYRALGEVGSRSPSEFFGLAALQVRRTLVDLTRRHFGPQGAAAHYRSDPDLSGRCPAADCHATGHAEGPQSLGEWTAFHEAVEALPAQEREVFHLVWYGGATYAEAAEALGMTRRTAIRRMNRARLRLAPAAAAVTIQEPPSDVQFHP